MIFTNNVIIVSKANPKTKKSNKNKKGPSLVKNPKTNFKLSGQTKEKNLLTRLCILSSNQTIKIILPPDPRPAL